ncbi:MAG: TlpA family protein disulfide reductase [Flavobacteriales bacterium]|jgi:peroxiredoxin
MKHLLTLLALAFALQASAQNVPSVNLKDVNGKTHNTASLVGQGKPVIVSFWATWCSPCKRELNNYMEYIEDWEKNYGASLIAVSIDDQRTANRVAPYINSVEWPYQVLLDPNRDFARTMQVTNVPHTFIIDGTGKIIWQNNNYSDGDEEEVEEILRKL